MQIIHIVDNSPHAVLLHDWVTGWRNPAHGEPGARHALEFFEDLFAWVTDNITHKWKVVSDCYEEAYYAANDNYINSDEWIRCSIAFEDDDEAVMFRLRWL